MKRTITIKIETDSEIPIEVLKEDMDRELSCCTYYGYFETVEISEMKLDDTPTADVVERKHGEWKERKTFYAGAKNPIEEWQSARCSICGKYHTTPYMYYFDDFNYCPSCGAEMVDKDINVRSKGEDNA